MIESGPLAGFTIGVTSVRRWHEFGTALEQRGARVVYAPAIRVIDPVEDGVLLDATVRAIEADPDIVVATTGIGFRSWLDAASAWGLAEQLRRRLSGAELIARGPRSRAALRAAGFTHGWSPEADSATEVLEQLLHRDVAGKRIVVQSHGAASEEFVEILRRLDAEVIEVIAYGWTEPLDREPLDQLVNAVAGAGVDALAFTTPAAVQSFIDAARRAQRLDDVIGALRGSTVAACIGPVTAGPLDRLDVPVAMPTRPRLGSLVRELVDVVARRAATVVQAADHRIEVRGHAVVVDGMPHLPGSQAMTVAKALVAYPGRVIARRDLARLLPEGADVDLAVATLSAAFADSRALQVIGRYGYRLAYEPSHTGGCGHDVE